MAATALLQRPLPVVREAVRDLLLSSSAYRELDPAERRELAQALVRVCDTAVALLKEEVQATPPPAPSPQLRPVLAMAQNAGQQFSGVSASRVAATTGAILNAVSFPRFVTELINGVFKAMVDSNQQQMHSYVDLIKNVAASTEGFADANLAPDRARQWLVETFPGSFTLEGESEEDAGWSDAEEDKQESRVRLKAGGSMPSEAALRTSLGIAEGESIPGGDPETALVPFARRALARQRQQLLATMVMLGMQRVVIESGRLNAAMRFHIDTRSAAASEEGSRFDFQNKTEASGKFGVGPWGVSAKMTNTIGYVSTQKNQTTEEMNTDLELSSSVELYFKTDYVPLDRLAGAAQVDRIKVNTLNPDAEAKAAAAAREARISSARTAESKRASELDKSLTPTPILAEPSQPPKAATQPAKTDAAKGGAKQEAGKKTTPGAKPTTGGASQGAAAKPAASAKGAKLQPPPAEKKAAASPAP